MDGWGLESRGMESRCVADGRAESREEEQEEEEQEEEEEEEEGGGLCR